MNTRSVATTECPLWRAPRIKIDLDADKFVEDFINPQHLSLPGRFSSVVHAPEVTVFTEIEGASPPFTT